LPRPPFPRTLRQHLHAEARSSGGAVGRLNRGDKRKDHEASQARETLEHLLSDADATAYLALVTLEPIPPILALVPQRPVAPFLPLIHVVHDRSP
jgi:hypothetical protein